MWLTPDGVPNMVSIPDPTAAMQQSFVESIQSLSADDRARLSMLLVDLEEKLFDLLATQDGAGPDAPAWEHLPDGYLLGSFDSVESIAEYVNQVEIAWRFDSFTAVQDLIDALDDGGPGQEH